jgi:hypothetical protein
MKSPTRVTSPTSPSRKANPSPPRRPQPRVAEPFVTEESKSAPASPREDTTTAQQAAALRRKGNELFKGGHYADAVNAYSAALTLRSDDAVCLVNRAAAFTMIEKYWNAVRRRCRCACCAVTAAVALGTLMARDGDGDGDGDGDDDGDWCCRLTTARLQ